MWRGYGRSGRGIRLLEGWGSRSGVGRPGRGMLLLVDGGEFAGISAVLPGRVIQLLVGGGKPARSGVGLSGRGIRLYEGEGVPSRGRACAGRWLGKHSRHSTRTATVVLVESTPRAPQAVETRRARPSPVLHHHGDRHSGQTPRPPSDTHRSAPLPGRGGAYARSGTGRGGAGPPGSPFLGDPQPPDGPRRAPPPYRPGGPRPQDPNGTNGRARTRGTMGPDPTRPRRPL